MSATATTQKFEATGRRKEATARVHVVPGKGEVSVNGKGISDYLARETLVEHAQRPLVATNTIGQYDVHCFANGGGLSGQAGAIRMAIARALLKMNPAAHSVLRREG